MPRSIYVNDDIGEVEFPDDMDDLAIADALHKNFPELGPNPNAREERPVSRVEMDPGSYWDKTLGLDDPNPPQPNLLATGGAGAPAPEPGSDAQRNLDAQAVPEMFGIGPETPESELPPDNVEGPPGVIPSTAASIVSGSAKMLGGAISETPRMVAEAVNLGAKVLIGMRAPQLMKKVPEIIPTENNALLDWAREEGKVTGAAPETYARINPDSGFAKALAESEKVGKESIKAMRSLTETGDITGVVKTITDPKAWGVFLGQAVPSLAIMFATKGNMGVMGWMEAMEASSNAAEFEEKTGTPLAEGEYAQAVIQAGAINAVLEKIGFSKIQQAMKVRGLSGKFFATVLAAIAEGTTEFAQGRNTKLAEKLAYNPNMTLDEILEGALAETMGGIGAGASFSAAGQAGEALISEDTEPPAPTPAPAQDELADIQQGRDAADLKEFMEDERPVDEILAGKRATNDAEIEAAEQEEIAAEEETVVAELEQRLAQAQAEGQIEEEATQQAVNDLEADLSEAEQAGFIEAAPEEGLIQQEDPVIPPPEGTGEQDSPVKVELPEDVDLAADQSDPAPTDAQKKSGNYKMGHLKLHGLDVTIENKRGDTRSGKDQDGETWEVTMPAHYGYIKRTLGADGDHVDVYIGEHPTSKEIFIVDQIDLATGRFDEHKIIFGTDNVEQAANLYDGGFSDGKGIERIGAIMPIKIAQFKNWLKNGNTKKPFRYDQKEAVARKAKEAKVSKTEEEAMFGPGQVPAEVEEAALPAPVEAKPKEHPPAQKPEPAPKPAPESKPVPAGAPIQEKRIIPPVAESQAPAPSEPGDAGVAPGQESVAPVTKQIKKKTEEIVPRGELGTKDLNGSIIPADLVVNVKIEVEGSDDAITIEVEAAETMLDLQKKLKTYEQLKECLR